MSTTSPPKPWQQGVASATTSPLTSPTNTGALTTTPSAAVASTNSATSRLKPWEREASGGRLDDVANSVTSRRSYADLNTDSGLSSYSRYGSNYGSNYGSYGSRYGSRYGNYDSYGSSYGGYGGGYGGLDSYGGGYGNNYGSYGGYGGYGSYGGYGGYGGYGDNAMSKYGPPTGGAPWHSAANRGFQFVDGIHSVTAGFGRFAGLLDANSQAMHGALSSIVRLIENAGFLYREIGLALSGFTLFRLIQRLFLRLLGRTTPAGVTGPNGKALTNGSNGAMDAVNEFNRENAGTGSGLRFWTTFLATICAAAFFGVPLLNRLLNKWAGPDDQAMNDAWKGNDPNQAGATPGNPILGQLRALHDYPAQNEHELSLRQGDIINVTQKPFEAWWEGEVQGQPGRLGLFPTNYTAPLDASAFPPS